MGEGQPLGATDLQGQAGWSCSSDLLCGRIRQPGRNAEGGPGICWISQTGDDQLTVKYQNELLHNSHRVGIDFFSYPPHRPMAQQMLLLLKRPKRLAFPALCLYQVRDPT